MTDEWSQGWSPVHLLDHGNRGNRQRHTSLNLPISKWTIHQGGNAIIYFSPPFIPSSALCRQLLVLPGKDNEGSFLYQTPFSRRQGPSISQSRMLGSGSLAWSPGMVGLPWDQAGLAVITNYLTIDISVPASCFLGCLCIMSGYEKKQ